MANRYCNLTPSKKISEDFQNINIGFDRVQKDMDGKATSSDLNALETRVDGLEVDITAVDNRVDEIIQGGGPDKDAELVDIRTPDPSYTPERTINVAGDLTRDMQKQFVAHLNEIASQVELGHVKVDGSTILSDAGVLSTLFKADPNKKYAIVAGVLRNTGEGWQQIPDHGSINIESVTADANTIQVNYPSLNVKRVVTFLAVPDETLVAAGYQFGASVGASSANITVAKSNVAGFISYNPATSTFDIALNSGIKSAVWQTNMLLITHDSFSPNNAVPYITGRDGPLNMAFGSLSYDTTQVKFYDPSGNQITTPDSSMRIYFGRPGWVRVDPTQLVSATGNIWVFGILEVS